MNETLSVTFTPTNSSDFTNYTGPVTITTTIDVLKVTPVLSWDDPSDITYGTPLSSTQLDATATIPGTFTYTPAIGTVLGAGKGDVLYVIFTPTDTTDYNTTTATAFLSVMRADPTVTWDNPADITYGTALGPVQLDATASIPGTFEYTPDSGTIPLAGLGQVLSTTFTPTDSVDYNSVTTTATINVHQATPVITWDNPADVPIGTPLSATQLDATADVPGTFTYTPALGTILPGGMGQVLFVSFTPTDAVDYESATATATINVTKADPTVTWESPADIPYGTPLSSTQLDATASVPGTFVYTPAAGTVLNAGAADTLSVTFTPTDTADYNTVTQTTTITVDQATLELSWDNPADITYGTALSSTQLVATASVPGTFVYTPDAGTVLGAGAGQTLSVTFTPDDSVDYSPATTTVTINVDPATPTITWDNPADITFGTALDSTQLDATADTAGTFIYSPPAGTVLSVGASQTLSVTFIPTDSARLHAGDDDRHDQRRSGDADHHLGQSGGHHLRHRAR